MKLNTYFFPTTDITFYERNQNKIEECAFSSTISERPPNVLISVNKHNNANTFLSARKIFSPLAKCGSKLTDLIVTQI